MEFTIVTAVTPEYEEKLRLVVPTWKRKPQFKNQPMILFTNGFTDPKERFKNIWDNLEIIEWDMEKFDSKRELMLSSFVLGTAKYVKTDYWVKIDCDTYFSTDEDVFCEDDLKYDVVGQRWGYSKPAYFLGYLDYWANKNNIAGEELFKDIDINKKSHGHKRIISYICLHKSSFIREIIEKCKDRLPVPSHDTFVWYMAARIPKYKIKRTMLKSKGVNQRRTLRSLKNEIYRDI